MSDYISREAAITAVKTHCPAKYETAVLVRLVCIPAANVAEVRHGHWEADKEERKICSVCGAWCICMRKDGLWLDKAAYCPYCGAKMDESEDEDNV